MTAKHEHLETNKVVLISDAGFTRNALAKAEANGVLALWPERLATDDPAASVLSALGAIRPKMVTPEITLVSVTIESPDGRREKHVVANGTAVFAAGQLRGNIGGLVLRRVDSPEFQQLGNAGLAGVSESSDRPFSFAWDDVIDPEGRELFVQRRDPSDSPLDKIVELRIEGIQHIIVAEAAFTPGRRLGQAEIGRAHV